MASHPGPKIAVGQDLDDPPGLGAQFGEVTATIHQKLGCVGHITSGCPRDLDEVHALGFQLFGLNPCVSHAYVRLVEFGTPVMIGGVEIHCGDLIHADKHGVCVIPHEVAHRLAAACAEVERREQPLLEYCSSGRFRSGGIHQAAERRRTPRSWNDDDAGARSLLVRAVSGRLPDAADHRRVVNRRDADGDGVTATAS